MEQYFLEWALLLGRWLHITAAMAWIGTSIFFMWLDRTLEPNPASKREGHVGELWMVHGGGFYQVEKMLMGPTRVPEHLHWFKWESYWTWLSGVFLTTTVFYLGNGTFLMDSAVKPFGALGFWPILGIAVGSILLSWLIYDRIWESNLVASPSLGEWAPRVGHALTLLLFGSVAWLLLHTLSGRAAYLHVGAMLGTWMTANVFLRIIPRQVQMVEASKQGKLDPVTSARWGKNAKNRSTHNTYLTLPVIFIMLSNHFPFTYGNPHAGWILILLSAAGAAIREFFVSRVKKPARARGFLGVGIVLLGLVIGVGREAGDAKGQVSEVSATHSVVTPQASSPTGPRIKGVVQFVGEVPQGKKLLLPFACRTTHQGDTYSNEVEVKNSRLKNVLVYVTQGLTSLQNNEVPKSPVLIDQRDCLYEPRGVAVRVGQPVEFINSDALFHNVKAVTQLNESFNVGMPKQHDRMTRVFTHPEIVVQAKCSVHPWMGAWIAVLDHPYFAVTNEAGEFDFSAMPPGKYQVEFWHETLGKQRQDIEVPQKGDLQLTASFSKSGPEASRP